jgi:triacylglycerol lipase
VGGGDGESVGVVVRRLLLVGVVVAALAGVAPATAAAANTDPALDVPAATLAAALHCPAAFTHRRQEPVLLVHGTYTNDFESWSWGYARVLPGLGFDVCTVTLPNRALDDVQVSAEYVVWAVEHMAAATGGKVDVIGHSQGGLEPRWAVRWWPTVQSEVDDLVTLAATNHGTLAANAACSQPCSGAIWQMATTSHFLAALNAGDETPGAISYTSIYSLTDELVVPQAPQSVSAMAGASNVPIQSVCPGRPVDHLGILADAVAFALVLDAFNHAGPADPARIDRTVCLQTTFPGADPPLLLQERFDGGSYDTLPAEPPLKAYATAAPSPPAPAPATTPAPAPAPAPTLPATGGPGWWGWAGAAALAAAGLSRRRRRPAG